MREKVVMDGPTERRAASRQLQTRDLPGLERANQCPKTRRGFSAERSRLVRRGQCMSSSCFLS
jgi:hypothetical protein